MSNTQPPKKDTGVANTNDPNATNPNAGLPSKESSAAANMEAHAYTNQAAQGKPQR